MDILKDINDRLSKTGYKVKGELLSSLVELYKDGTSNEKLFYGEEFEGWVLQIHTLDKTFTKRSVGGRDHVGWITLIECEICSLINILNGER